MMVIVGILSETGIFDYLAIVAYKVLIQILNNLFLCVYMVIDLSDLSVVLIYQANY